MDAVWNAMSRRFSASSVEEEGKDLQHEDSDCAANRVGLHKKEAGNKLFKDKRYHEALEMYSEGIDSFPFDENGNPAVVIQTKRSEDNVLAVLFSNRSATWLSLGNAREGLVDANRCITLEPKWPRGHQRKAKCLMQLGKFKEAAQAFSRAFELESAGRKEDSIRHAQELEAVRKQHAANADAFSRLLQENHQLRTKLEDFSMVFGEAGKKHA